MANRHSPPRAKEIGRVISLGGNQCAFDACDRPIFRPDKSELLGEIAHIKARSPSGPRFDPRQSSEENRSVENLMAMCKEHADLIDLEENLAIYTVERLTAMKEEHEARVERRADRGWITWPNSITQLVPTTDGSEQQVTIYYWIDRRGQARIYTPQAERDRRHAFEPLSGPGSAM